MYAVIQLSMRGVDDVPSDDYIVRIQFGISDPCSDVERVLCSIERFKFDVYIIELGDLKWCPIDTIELYRRSVYFADVIRGGVE